MIKNYFKIAWRNLIKNKTYTLLNIVGLSAGLTCFAFITLWIKDEWSYDRFNTKADRIYRVVGKYKSDAEIFEQAVTSVPMGPTLKNDYPEVENFVRFDKSDAVVKNGTQMYAEEGFLVTEPSFFDMYSYKMTQGDPKTALSDPYSIILTERMARKYFGSESPIGKTLSIMLYDSTGKGAPYKVTGVMPDAPKNAHLTFNFLVSFETLIASDRKEFMSDNAWGDNSYYTYLLLKNGASYKELESKLPQFYEKYLAPLNRKYGGAGRTDYTLQPLTDIYLTSHRRYEISPTGSLANLYIFGTAGLFILLIAGINYMNLATSRSIQRAKEVGVKKVLGALKSQLIAQYLFEAILLAMASLLAALFLCKLFQPFFHQITDKDISVFSSPLLLSFMLAASFFLGLLSGVYPAFFISSYQPASVLKGAFSTSGKGVWLRKSLVVLQFTITIILIAGILIINNQTSFIQHKDLGYSRDAILTLKVNGDKEVTANIEAFKNDLKTNPLIRGFTTSNSILVGGMGNNGATTVDNQGKKLYSSTYRLTTDYDYLDVMGMKLLAGRNFSREFPTDERKDSTQNFILNEAAVKAFGWETPNKAIGKPFMMSGRNGKVVGIVKDFHFNSLQHPVEPIAMLLRGKEFAQILLKVDMQRPKEAIIWVENQWKKHFPTSYLDYAFLDKKLNDQYKAEERFSTIFLYFSILSMLIACLGLYGLTSFATEQRAKEIGIRKVLGASIAGIVGLFSKDFLQLILLSVVIATPIAWWAMNRWLQDFAYRIEVGWQVFALAGFMAMLIALVTVSFKAVRAAAVNPVKSLRTE